MEFDELPRPPRRIGAITGEALVEECGLFPFGTDAVVLGSAGCREGLCALPKERLGAIALEATRRWGCASGGGPFDGSASREIARVAAAPSMLAFMRGPTSDGPLAKGGGRPCGPARDMEPGSGLRRGAMALCATRRPGCPSSLPNLLPNGVGGAPKILAEFLVKTGDATSANAWELLSVRSILCACRVNTVSRAMRALSLAPAGDGTGIFFGTSFNRRSNCISLCFM
mmetsp:Transcript_27426/g.74923  ORF Transcript_27426/g.74923 Transcript_27426/m.74923 type:complete len:228 (+) Transcript_27426:405-1088(+)|eukprot:scaffold282909_cov23-Tisochrysis_lutea.AAC.1